MSSSKSKELRSQLRAVIREQYPEMWSKEAQENIMRQLAPMVETILADIRKNLLLAVEANQKKTQESDNKLLTAASNYLQEMNVSMESWQTLIQEKLKDAFVIGDNFKKELEDRKQAVKERLYPTTEVVLESEVSKTSE